MEHNFKTLFETMPGDMYNMSSSGRVRAHRGHIIIMSLSAEQDITIMLYFWPCSPGPMA